MDFHRSCHCGKNVEQYAENVKRQVIGSCWKKLRERWAAVKLFHFDKKLDKVVNVVNHLSVLEKNRLLATCIWFVWRVTAAITTGTVLSQVCIKYNESITLSWCRLQLSTVNKHMINTRKFWLTLVIPLLLDGGFKCLSFKINSDRRVYSPTQVVGPIVLHKVK